MQLAQHALKSILEETYSLHGWNIPKHIVNYQTDILASKIDKNPWQPEPSYAERYMAIRTSQQALDLADTCWFTRSVFPELGAHRGINSSYYVDMGLACYALAQRTSPSPTLELMAKHFEFLAECAYTAIRHYGDFRSMWD